MNTTHYMIELAPDSNSTYARDAAEECNTPSLGKYAP